jgi:ligand-binding SRPBCC domain-containing protein
MLAWADLQAITMHSYTRNIIIRSPIEEVFLFHTDVKNLIRITPPFIKVIVEHADPAGQGQNVHLLVKQFGIIPMRMHMEFFLFDYPACLADRQITGPFKSMIQYRHFEDMGGGYTRMCDVFEYELPFGKLGKIAHSLFVKKMIEQMFVHRQNITKKLLEM